MSSTKKYHSDFLKTYGKANSKTMCLSFWIRLHWYNATLYCSFIPLTNKPSGTYITHLTASWQEKALLNTGHRFLAVLLTLLPRSSLQKQNSRSHSNVQPSRRSRSVAKNESSLSNYKLLYQAYSDTQQICRYTDTWLLLVGQKSQIQRHSQSMSS